MPPRRAGLVAALPLMVALAMTCLRVSPSLAQVPPASNGRTVDHADWNAVLGRHVHQGAVDYDGIARDAAFPRYLSTLERTNVDALDNHERLAFWLNAYNAWTVQLILKHGERESIRNINRTLGVLRLKGPWNEVIGTAAGKQWTLDAVEHQVLRGQFREPRIHFAMVPAARGGPPLRAEAYTGARLEEQLDAQTREFLSDSVHNRFANGALWLSPIFTYYRSDFVASPTELGAYLAPYFPEARAALEARRYFLRQTRFDWSLNSVRLPRPAVPSADTGKRPPV